MSTALLNARARQTTSSAIRDLLDQARRGGMISLAGGLPDPNEFPVAQLADIAAGVVRSRPVDALQYGTTQGEEATRAALGTLYGGVDFESMAVTTGSQQGLDLLARVLIEPGDTVVTADPDYLGMLQVLRSHGARPHAIPMHADGLDTDKLAADLRGGLRPKACYVIAHFHNPTGITQSPERRRHLAELSQRYGFVIIEDDPYRQLYYEGTGPTEMSADPQLTVRLRSTSKILTPGLRVGALAGPDWLVDAVVRQKQAADLHTSTLSQAIVTEALCGGWLADHVAGLRRLYGTKRDTLLALLDAHFGERLRVTRPSGGMFAWAEVADGTDTSQWLDRALGAGVCFVPGAAFAVHRDMTSALRLSFVTATEAELAEAVARLASVLSG